MSQETKLQENLKDRFQFKVGDTIDVGFKITEGEKTRVQVFSGTVIGRRGTGNSETFVVRKIANAGIGVERIFPTQSPLIEYIRVKKPGKVRRAKLYYLRQKSN